MSPFPSSSPICPWKIRARPRRRRSPMVKSILAIVLSCAAGAIAQAPSADGQIVEVDLNAATSVTIHAASTRPADIAQQIAPDDIRFINPTARLDPVSLDAAGEPLL